ncbi:hypothetical protein N8J89_34325 [Crossiella sp. CA-258035]|uniref:trypsin-like serine peptidase n=1 Tax=Crossiella sp. CA-258035 TaxID=2981138 RepID=UPI0024BC7031|nr:trypsin-like peptidase domain-containing protein [Crossiella sp. CA-258035]WHT18140.1 hypothetical protein N8J89_34325 [Crossiella sp. CA-258035]
MRLIRLAMGAALVLSTTLTGGAAAAPADGVELAVHEAGGGTSTVRVPAAQLSSMAATLAQPARPAPEAAGVYRTTNGHMSAYTGDGNVSECSASVINSPNRRVLVTAAHCLYRHTESKPWIQTLRFVPGLRPGPTQPEREPVGGWAGATFVVPKSWTLIPEVKSEHLKWDLGFVVMQDRRDGTRLGDAVPGHGLRVNAPYGQPTTVVGYPFTSKGNQEFCAGAATRQATYDWHQLPCSFGSGASGGPWLHDYDANGLGYVIGVSHSLDANGRDNYSAHFGDLALSLYNYVKDR